MRIDDGHIDSFFSSSYLENRAKFLETLHHWTERLPPGIVDIEEEQTEDAGYFVKFRPVNPAACYIGMAYYGIPKTRFGAECHSLDLSLSDGKHIPCTILQKSPLSLEPVLEILEAAKEGRIIQYHWWCHVLTEFRLNSKVFRHRNPVLPLLDYFDEFFVKRLLKKGPRRIVKYEAWAPRQTPRDHE